MNLVLELEKAMKETPNMTVDEFFDKMNIPKKVRSDFAFAAILNQVEKLK